MSHFIRSLFTTASHTDAGNAAVTPAAPPEQPAPLAQHAPGTAKRLVMQCADPDTRLAVFRTCKDSWQWVLEDSPDMTITVLVDAQVRDANLMLNRLEGVRDALAARGTKSTTLVLEQSEAHQQGLRLTAMTLRGVGQHVKHLTVHAPVLTQRTVRALCQAFPTLHTLQLSLSNKQVYVAALQHMGSIGWVVKHLWVDTELTDVLVSTLLTCMPDLQELTALGMRAISHQHTTSTWKLHTLQLKVRHWQYLQGTVELQDICHLPRREAGEKLRVHATKYTLTSHAAVDAAAQAHLHFESVKHFSVHHRGGETSIEDHDCDLEARVLPLVQALAHTKCDLTITTHWLSPGLIRLLEKAAGYQDLNIVVKDCNFPPVLLPPLPPVSRVSWRSDVPIEIGWALRNLAKVQLLEGRLDLTSSEHSDSPCPWHTLGLWSDHPLTQLLHLPDASNNTKPASLEVDGYLYLPVMTREAAEALAEKLDAKLQHWDVNIVRTLILDPGWLPRERRAARKALAPLRLEWPDDEDDEIDSTNDSGSDSDNGVSDDDG